LKTTLQKQLAPGQPLRFLLVGGFNTIFGIADTLLFTKLLLTLHPDQPKLMTSLALVPSYILNIAFSFLSNKWFVFQTKGNYRREYVRSLSVYLPTFALNFFATAPMVALMQRTRFSAHAPFVATGILLTITVAASYFGHKHISFKQDGAPPVAI